MATADKPVKRQLLPVTQWRLAGFHRVGGLRLRHTVQPLLLPVTLSDAWRRSRHRRCSDYADRFVSEDNYLSTPSLFWGHFHKKVTANIRAISFIKGHFTDGRDIRRENRMQVMHTKISQCGADVVGVLQDSALFPGSLCEDLIA